MSPAEQTLLQTYTPEQLAKLNGLTGFQKIAMLNNLAGNLANGGWPAIDAQFKLLESEFNELRDAIAERDIEKVRAESADIEVVNLGLAHRIGADADADLHEVVLSNLTKFDPEGTDDLQHTVARFLDLNVVTSQLVAEDPLCEGRRLYITRSAFPQYGNDEKDYPQGKWLKSHRFVKPQMPPLSQEATHALLTTYNAEAVEITPESLAKACGQRVSFTISEIDLDAEAVTSIIASVLEGVMGRLTATAALSNEQFAKQAVEWCEEDLNRRLGRDNAFAVSVDVGESNALYSIMVHERRPDGSVGELLHRSTYGRISEIDRGNVEEAETLNAAAP